MDRLERKVLNWVHNGEIDVRLTGELKTDARALTDALWRKYETDGYTVNPRGINVTKVAKALGAKPYAGNIF